MSTVLKADIAQAYGQALIDDIFLQNSRYYYTIGRSQPWEDGVNPDQVVASEKYQKEMRQDILYAKQISGTSLTFTIPRYNYQSGVSYTKYDDTVNLTGQKFYVISSDYNIYKCLDNKQNGVSSVEPYGTAPYPITLDDGYVWQYIYSIPPSLRTKFLTETDMPVFNTITEKYYSRGSISSVKIASGGSGYDPLTTQIIVSGDGYLEDNPINIDNFVIGYNGSGYTSIPDVEVENPFSGTISFSPSTSLIKGQKISVSDVAGVRFYEAITSGTLSSTAPTHYKSTSTNGTVQLKHIGTKPKITSTINSSGVGSIVVIDGGFGYSTIPTVTKDATGSGCVLSAIMDGDSISKVTVVSNGNSYVNQNVTVESPFPLAEEFPLSTAVNSGDIFWLTISGDTYYYRVDSAGTTSSTVPSHTTGSASNGTSVLTVVGKLAKVKAILGLIDSVTKHFDISNIKITNGGSGYVQESTEVIFTGGNPEIPAIANAVVSSGVITSIEVTFPGYGYESAPTVSINGDGSSATVNVEMGCGYGYSLAPSLIFSEPDDVDGTSPYVFSTVTKTEAIVEPIVIDGILRGISVINGGIGYTLATLSVVGTGSGASLTPIFASSELNSIQAQSELLATEGTISSFVIDDRGENITSISIELVGDGTGADITPVIEYGRLVDIIINDTGSGYSYITTNIIVNSGATQPSVRAVLAPINGHGSDPIRELYSSSIALNVAIGNEVNNGFAFNNKFRQIGIIKAPLTIDGTKLLESSSASACLSVSVNTSGVPLSANDILTGEGNSTYRVIDFNSTKILISSLTNTVPALGSSLKCVINTIEYSMYVNAVELPEFDKNSGSIIFIDNQDEFTPSATQTINVTTNINLI